MADDCFVRPKTAKLGPGPSSWSRRSLS